MVCVSQSIIICRLCVCSQLCVESNVKESIPTENQSNSVWFIERFNKQDQQSAIQNLKKIEKQNNKNNNKYKVSRHRSFEVKSKGRKLFLSCILYNRQWHINVVRGYKWKSHSGHSVETLEPPELADPGNSNPYSDMLNAAYWHQLLTTKLDTPYWIGFKHLAFRWH